MRFKKVFSKRVLAGLVALTTISATSSLSSSATINSSMQYKIFNNSTGSITRTYTLSALNTVNNSANSRGIVGDEQRENIATDANAGVVRIVSTAGDSYTGFVVGENIIATAASNVYDLTSDTLKKINRIFLYDSDGNADGTTTAVTVHMPTNFTDNSLSDYGYALIKVNADLSSHQVFNLGMPLTTLDTSTIAEDMDIRVTGIPDVFNGSTNTELYTGRGNIEYFSIMPIQRYLSYSCDITNGQQGSPVYKYVDYQGTKYYTVLAINTVGDAQNGYNGELNYGLRVTTDMLHFYNNNPNI